MGSKKTKFVPEVPAKRWNVEARKKERSIQNPLWNHMDHDEKLIASFLVENPSTTHVVISKATNIPLWRISALKKSPKVVKYLESVTETSTELLQRLQEKAVKHMETHIDKGGRLGLDAAKHVTQKVFNQPTVQKVDIPVLDPASLRELAKTVLESESISVTPTETAGDES